MTRQKVIIVDADGIIAQNDSKDPHHEKAQKIARKLTDMGAQVLYPVTAITEANAHTQRVLNSTASAYGTAVFFASQEPEVVEVSKETLIDALNFFSPNTSKKNTLFDCIVAAVAQEHKADAIFSFDSFYKKQGFKLASELR